jgi:hypothetical protein
MPAMERPKRYDLKVMLTDLQVLVDKVDSPLNEWAQGFVESNYARIVTCGFTGYSDKQWDKTIALWEKHCDKAINTVR